MKLTKTAVDKFTAPEKGDDWYWDSELPGFGVRVQASGRKTYIVRYRAQNAKQRKMTIARVCDMPPDRARDLARKVFAQVAEGSDPAADKRPSKEKSATVENLFQAYADSLKAKGKASAPEVERMLLKAQYSAADALGRDTAASEVKPIDVIKFISHFFNQGRRGAADKARSYIASAYSWGVTSANDYTVPAEQRIDWGIVLNPASSIAKDGEAIGTRDRNLSVEEVRDLWGATLDGSFGEDIGACIRILIACGQRVQETLRIDGSEINLTTGVWHMPASKTKGGKHAHNIPLPPVILPTMKALIEQYGEGSLFPGGRGSEELIGHRSVNQAIKRWLSRKDVDVPAFQTRDLRRTWKSRTHDAGIDRFTRDLIQQHAKGDTGSKHYDRSDYLPQMREAMNKWSSWLGIVLSGGKPPAHGEPMMKVVGG